MSRGLKILLVFIGGLLLVLLILAVIGLVFFSLYDRPSVSSNSVLVINLSGQLPDYVPEDPIAEALEIEQGKSFISLITQLRKAKTDSKIAAVLVNIDFPAIGWAKAEELRRALLDVREAGKPVYAYMEVGTIKEYYIATAADKIFLPPSGDLYITGLMAEVMFFRGALDKLGIEPQVIQIGKYKNAPDQYTRKQMSPEHREVINAVLDDYFNRLTTAIAEARKKTPDEVRTLIDEAPYSAKKANELGLIDGALYKEEVYDELKSRLGYKEDEKLRLVSAESYRRVSADSLGLNTGEKIAVIFAAGPINSGESESFYGQTIGSNTMVRAISDAASDDSIKAIVIRVDSPGGSALASDLIWHAIEKAKAKKPVVVSMSDVAASGGYYISCNANKIVAESSTITGSIGVFLGKPVLKGFYDWLGLNNEYVMRGKNAGLFRETERWTPEEEAKMRELANRIYYDEFVPKVAQGRGRSLEEIDSIGQGRVWTGAQAKERGLVDEIGGLEKAIEIAKELAGLPADKDVQRITFPKPRPFFERLLGRKEDETFAATRKLIETMPENIQKAIKYALIFERTGKGDAMMLMPFELTLK
ncbi:MAG: signal peptide peptidase SppA [Acidobacteria bacterium]|nr:MAG: signal peptide peptidase SppA [Acidobacteriota bacterium]